MDHLSNPVVSSLLLFCVYLLHSLIMWLIISSLSPYNLHLLFCCALSLIILVFLAMFCVANRRSSVSLLKFPFLSHVKFSRMRFLMSVAWNIPTVVFHPIFFCSLDGCVVCIVSGPCNLWKFVKELVILFHRISAATWGHVVSTIKRAPSEDSSSFFHSHRC